MNFFLLHGTMMWIAWSLFSLVMISSNRYLKGHLWNSRMWIHRIFGALILIITLYFAIMAWKNLGWEILDNIHSYFVFPVLFSVLFVVLLGVATRSIMRRSVWNTKFALNFKLVHKVFAYSIIVCGNLAIAAGIYEYRVNPKHPSDFALEWLNICFFVFFFLTIEIFYQKGLN